MNRTLLLAGLALAGAQALPSAANAAVHTYHYTVTHHLYGPIGVYDRTIDDAGGGLHAVSHLRIVVRLLGLVVHREDADQTEDWRDGRLMSFQTLTTVNGQPLAARGRALGGKFEVTSPVGTTLAPADVVASDPLSLSRIGPGSVVSIKSGKVEPAVVTGGEAESLVVNGIATPTRHFHVNTATQPNKWEVWMDGQGVPVKFRSIETGGAVDFILVSSS